MLLSQVVELTQSGSRAQAEVEAMLDGLFRERWLLDIAAAFRLAVYVLI